MRKEKHYITTYAGKGKRTFQLVDGYTETISGVAFGFRKNGCGWVATDILTGLAVINGGTRKEAVERATIATEKVKAFHKEKIGYEAIQMLEKFKLDHMV